MFLKNARNAVPDNLISPPGDLRFRPCLVRHIDRSDHTPSYRPTPTVTYGGQTTLSMRHRRVNFRLGRDWG